MAKQDLAARKDLLGLGTMENLVLEEALVLRGLSGLQVSLASLDEMA